MEGSCNILKAPTDHTWTFSVYQLYFFSLLALAPDNTAARIARILLC